MNALNPPALREYLKRNSLSQRFIGRALIVCFRPTGWTFNASRSSARSVRPHDNAVMFQLPYSEHSSFDELCKFVKWLKPRRLIPMVGARSPEKSEQMKSMLAHRDRPLADQSAAAPS
ncbi:DNA cross-link repair 1A protein [Gracilariopsis chorda]|uniref:DNA cross-link repair 1A protein n=1 Tax=Gracilariopsis chorda TaxID=448386 RepID=A0A2V3J019_9FLOR|nr:DNA cross-link repair 1A protein [Gracilariopsis chorda]|eukprot:PXF47675.1 DNA cross-link repair 1A protein [Gracilariopsis chorda]